MSVLKFALAFALAIVVCSSASAQNFTGQSIGMIVNYPAGGPTDIEARIVAKHLPRYLPGINAIVVRNMGGGGGNIGVNALGEASDHDKLSISFFTWDPIDQLLQNPNLHVKYNELKFIAAFKMTTLLYIRRDTPPGIGKPSDIARAPLFKTGSLVAGSHGTVRQRLALDLLGVKYDNIAGYKGLGEVYVAVRRGDVQLTNISLPSWSAQVKPTLVDTGVAIPLLQYGSLKDEGPAGRSLDLPDVPAFMEVFKEIKGKDAMPGGEKWQALQLLTRILDSMYRTVFMPPNAPPAAVAEMRNAMARLEKDQEFLADYEKVVKGKPRFVLGADGEQIISELGKVSPAFVGFLRAYIAENQ